MAMVDAAQPDADRYVPVHAVSMTGLFPGFARPHFAPENLDRERQIANTLYIQRVMNEKIVGFDPLGTDVASAQLIALPRAAGAQVGDGAVYVYAFGTEDAVVGNRDVVADAIADRFEDIAPKAFAACTAAYFARLIERLPQANQRAFALLAELDRASAYHWRDATVFRSAICDQLDKTGLPARQVRVRTKERAGALELEVTVPSHLKYRSAEQLEAACRDRLIETGLFRPEDRLILQLDADGYDDQAQLRMPEPGELDAILKEAQVFLEAKVFLPALRYSTSRTLNIVRNTRHWISKFQKIGDLILYLDRFKPDRNQASFAFPEIRQIRFEDVHAEFTERYGRYRGVRTTIADFHEGRTYSPFTLSIYTRSYDNRGGGIRPVGKLGAHEAVVVNITLSGRRYANQWLEIGKRLKCYLKAPSSRKELTSEETHEANRCIMHYPEVPILVFTKGAGESEFMYRGIFRYEQVSADEGGKWFELVKKTGVVLPGTMN